MTAAIPDNCLYSVATPYALSSMNGCHRKGWDSCNSAVL